MKQLLTLVFVIGIASNLFSQNVLTLKSGEKMSGKVDRFKNDSLTFKFKGNLMKFSSKEIESIYFDENAIQKAGIKPLPTVSEPNKEQKGKISGVVTYFFNDNYRYKPDIGATVSIISVEKIPIVNYKNIENYMSSKNNVQMDDETDEKAYQEITQLKFRGGVDRITLGVDGSGNFSTDVPSGVYYLLVVSTERTRHTKCEFGGKFYCSKVEVNPNQTSSFNIKFDID